MSSSTGAARSMYMSMHSTMSILAHGNLHTNAHQTLLYAQVYCTTQASPQSGCILLQQTARYQNLTQGLGTAKNRHQPCRCWTRTIRPRAVLH